MREEAGKDFLNHGFTQMDTDHHLRMGFEKSVCIRGSQERKDPRKASPATKNGRGLPYQEMDAWNS